MAGERRGPTEFLLISIASEKVTILKKLQPRLKPWQKIVSNKTTTALGEWLKVKNVKTVGIYFTSSQQSERQRGLAEDKGIQA